MKKNNNNTPPLFAQCVLCWFLKDELAEEVLGDLEEKFDLISGNKSRIRAQIDYWFQVVNYLRPFALKRYRQNSNYFIMHAHNFKIIYRHFLRNKTSFTINFLSLVAGLVCSLFIYIWADDQVKTDQFHTNKDYLYQILLNDINPDEVVTEPHTPGLLAQTLLDELPQVEKAVSVVPYEWFEGEKLLVSDGNGKIFTSKNLFASSDYFNVFSFNLLHGNPNQVLQSIDQVVISNELSQKLFGEERSVGKSLEWFHEDFGGTYQISGVFEKTGHHSTLQFDAVFHYDKFLEDNEDLMEWNNSDPYTYVVVNENTDIAEFKSTIDGFLQTKIDIKTQQFYPQLFSEKYLHSNYENGVSAGGRITYIRLFSGIAFIVLLVACINFTNMTTAEATGRMKEIGVKKAIGINKRGLIIQYLTESVMMAVISLIAALLIVYLLLPQFSILVERQLVFSFSSETLMVLFSVMLFTGIISGVYPAFYLSSLAPGRALKGESSQKIRTQSIRKALIVSQFVVSTLLVVSVVVVYQQIEYIQSKSLGYDKDNIIWFTAGIPDNPDGDQELSEAAIENLVQQLKNTTGVVNATNFAHHMVGDFGTTTGLSWPGKDPDQRVLFAGISGGYDFINTMKIKLKSGRSFSRDFKTDTDKIILNEKAIAMMGMTDPIGKSITLWDKDREIVGVLEDFHIDLLYNDISPTFIKLDLNSFASNFMVRLAPGNEQQTIERIEEVYKDFFVEGMPFEYKFLDDNYQELYQYEVKVGLMTKYAALMVIFISGLGLFGFSSFIVRRRIKEIGIRKVLGASRFTIAYFLTTDFTKLIAISLALALPIAFYLADLWLDSFAFSISLKWWFFIGSGFLIMALAWLTVALQTMRAAQTNPVDCLRDE